LWKQNDLIRKKAVSLTRNKPMDIEEMVKGLQESGKSIEIVIHSKGICAYNFDSEMLPLFGWNWEDESFSLQGETLGDVLSQCLERMVKP
jgi:hypothetical protein